LVLKYASLPKALDGPLKVLDSARCLGSQCGA
jgi:hypothetical protein